jgi:cytochrome c oxidase subunit 2
MAEMGAKLFTDFGCATCHQDAGGGRGPSLRGLFGAQATLASGEKVPVDEAYIRESILTPTAKMVAGFQPLMPTFQGVLSEEQIAQLTAYMKSLAATTGPPATAPDAGGATGAAPAPGATPQPAGH